MIELYEREIQAAIRIALGRDPTILLFRNSAGITNYQGRVARFGLAPGAADLVGGITVEGILIFLGLEVKRPGGRLSEHQRQWGALIERRGGVYIVASSAVEAVDKVEAARESIRSRMHRFRL